MFIRCEQTVGNSPAEIEATTAAARAFLRAELEVRRSQQSTTQYSRDNIKVQNLGNPSFEEHLTAASASYMQAARLQEEAGRSVQLKDLKARL